MTSGLRGFYGSLREHLPPATLWLLIVNIGIFIVSLVIIPLGNLLVQWGAAWPRGILHGQAWRLLSYMFLHGGAGHLLFNMLTLYFFSPRLEYHLGTRRFMTFYFSCGLGAAVVHTVASLFGGGANAFMIGASGALYGILMANAFYWPETTVYLNLLFPIKMKYLVWIFGLLAFLGSVSPQQGNISHITHLGGLLTAMLLLWGPRWLGRGGRGGGGGFGGGGGWGRRKQTPARVRSIYDDPHWKLDQ